MVSRECRAITIPLRSLAMLLGGVVPPNAILDFGLQDTNLLGFDVQGCESLKSCVYVLSNSIYSARQSTPSVTCWRISGGHIG